MYEKLIVAAAALILSVSAFADCTIAIKVGDSLAFDTSEISVPSTCSEVTVTIEHTGTLPAQAMGHNWVLAADADWEAVASAGTSSGFEGNFFPAGDDRVIAATKLVGGGESDSITFSTSGMDADASYSFFCSFPGHWSVMRGSFKII
ncbi:MAG: azurin [Pseudomonadota bacterium]